MKQLLLPVIVVAMSVNADATIITHDPVLNAQTIADEIANYAKQCAQYLKQCDQWIEEHTTALKEIQQVENEVLQLERMGDPRACMTLPGVSNIVTLGQIYQQAQQDAVRLAQLANPQNAVVDAQKILAAYEQPMFNGFTTMDGFKVSPAQGVFQFSTANYNVAISVQGEITTLNAKKQELTAQRDSAIASLQSATDQSTVQKYTAIINALNGSIADVNASINQAVHQGQLQLTRNEAAQQLYQSSQSAQQRAADLQSLDRDVMSLPASGVHQPINWGQ